MMYKKILIIFALIMFFSQAFPKGLKAYNFSLKDENGKTVKLQDLKGNVVYLIFWATTCSTCRKELPQINKLYKKYNDQNVKFYAIVIDTKDIDKIKRIKKEWGFDIPVLIGNYEIKSKYRIIGTPITYILRKDLTIGKILYGAVSLEKLEKFINKFLKE